MNIENKESIELRNISLRYAIVTQVFVNLCVLSVAISVYSLEGAGLKVQSNKLSFMCVTAGAALLISIISLVNILGTIRFQNQQKAEVKEFKGES